MTALLKKSLGVFGSFGLSVTLLVFLFILTGFGTWAQADIGLFQVQRDYFESWFVWQDLGVLGRVFDVQLPSFWVVLPGGVLLMSLLAVNLIVGGVVRLRHSWSRAGILVGHLGVAMMLLAGLVEFTTAYEGAMSLNEGHRAAQFASYHDWELALVEQIGDGKHREWTVPLGHGNVVGPDDTMTIRGGEAPFTVTVSRFSINARIRKGAGATAVNGFLLDSEPPREEQGANSPACRVEVRGTDGSRHAALLWGRRSLFLRTDERDVAWTFEVEGRTFGAVLRRERYDLPFGIELSEFHHELHPGMGMAAAFKSDVVVHDGSIAQPVRIQMNEPLRRAGFVVYQESWGPGDGNPNIPIWSQFAISWNPSDKWPEYSCWVIAVGLLWHFGLMLSRFVRRELRAAA